MAAPKIAFICASLREGSINKTLEKALIKRFKAAGAKTSSIDLSKYEMPIYFVSPEYNGCLPALLKNTIDWTSTVSTDYIKTAVIGLASCTPGPMSGIMCMRQMQFILTRLGGDVLPVQVGCGNASQAFNTRGDLVAPRTSDMADNMRDMMLERIAQKG